MGGQLGGTIFNCSSNSSAVYVGFYSILGLGETCPFPYTSADVMDAVEFQNSSSCMPYKGAYLSFDATESPCRAGDAPVLNVGGCTRSYFSLELGACIPSDSMWTDAAATTTLNADGTVTVSEFSSVSNPSCAAAPFCVYENITTDGTCQYSQPKCAGRRDLQPISITLAATYPPTPAASPAAGPNVPLIVGSSLGLCLLVAAALGAWRWAARSRKEKEFPAFSGYAKLASLARDP